MATTTAVARIEAKQANRAAAIEAAGSVAKGAKEIALELIRNPLFSMVGSVVAIELLQRVEIQKVPREWGQIQVGPLLQWGWVKTPLLSQPLATTLESAIITSETIKSLGGLGGLAGLIGAFIK